MAHPYKQKYNNFNGPGHQSPAHIIGPIGRQVTKRILKPIGNKLDNLWQATKNAFVKKNSVGDIDWNKTKSHIGKLTMTQAALVKGSDMLRSFDEQNEMIRERDNLRSNEDQWDKTINDKLRITNEPNLDSILKANK